MEIKTYKNQEIKDTPHKVDVRQLYDKDAAQAMHITLKEGESLKPHKTPVDVFFYVLEGLPTIHVGDEHIQCKKDRVFSIASSPQSEDIIEPKPDARILVVKAPKPTEATKVL